MNNHSHRILVMGVSGSGKSYVGQQLAVAMGATFLDGDDYHSPANVAKMARGTPLNDDDRWGWLNTLAGKFADYEERNASVVIACSGLKRSYRDRLRKNAPTLNILYLEGNQALLRERLEARPEHFFKGESMLASQLADLEPPGSDEAVSVSIALPANEIVRRFTATLALPLRQTLG